MILENLLARGRVPDALIRLGIRRLLARRLRSEAERAWSAPNQRTTWIEELRASPIAVHTDAANEQHYTVPPAFFEHVLGPRLKYSSGYWGDGIEDLAGAEAAMLRLTVERGGLEDGMEVLDLGCGWGSLSLWIAEHFPACRVLAVSNSASQRAFIEARCKERGFESVEVVTADVQTFETERRFDRVFSIEMFEHMRNYEKLLRRIAGWLRPDGRLFVHIFVHERYAYPFETEGASNWMGRHFFTGGQMPSDDLLLYFQDDVVLRGHWRVNGSHYAKTARAWLENLDRERDRIEPLLAEASGDGDGGRAVEAWRIFFMACEELWRWRGGTEWFVSHYLFAPRAYQPIVPGSPLKGPARSSVIHPA